MKIIQFYCYFFYFIIFNSSALQAQISDSLAKAIEVHLSQSHNSVIKIKDPVEAGMSGALGVMFLKLDNNDRAIKIFNLSDKMAQDEYNKEYIRVKRPEYKEITQKMDEVISSGLLAPKAAITTDFFTLVHEEEKYGGLIMEMAKGEVFRNFHADKLLELNTSPDAAYELFKSIGIAYGHLDAVIIRDLKVLIIHPDSAGGAKNVYYDKLSNQVTWVDISNIEYEKNTQRTAEMLLDRSGSPWEVCPNVMFPKIAHDIAIQTPSLEINDVTRYKNHFEIELASCRGLADGYIDGLLQIQNQTKADQDIIAINELITIFKKSYHDLMTKKSFTNASIINSINNIMDAYKLRFSSPWWKL